MKWFDEPEDNPETLAEWAYVLGTTALFAALMGGLFVVFWLFGP